MLWKAATSVMRKPSCLKIACKNGVKKGESIRQLAFLLLNIVAKVQYGPTESNHSMPIYFCITILSLYIIFRKMSC